MGKIANVENSQACHLEGASEHCWIVGTIRNTSFLVVTRNSAADFWRIFEHQSAIGWVAHFEPEFGDDLGVRLVGDVDDIRVTVLGRSPGTCCRRTADTAIAAGLVRADHVLAPFAAEWVHLFHRPLVVPEERADDSNLRIGKTVWPCTECGVAHVAELAGLSGVHPRPGRIEPDPVRPAITLVLPGRELLRIGRVREVHDLYEAADAFKALAEVIREARPE